MIMSKALYKKFEAAGKKDKPKKKKDPIKTYNVGSNYGNLSYTTGGSSSGSGTRWYNVTKGDISGLLQSYEDQAASARNIATSTYNTTRNDLLTALKRYQEKNASDVQNQKQSYLTEQANLEATRESANRQSRISAAARGLGGSGLQQLAQLQNMIGQSEEVSQAANKNQAAMTDLANQLKEYTEDNESKQKSNLENYRNTLNSIASTLANQRAEAIANNEQRYIDAINARNAAVAQYSYSSSPGTTINYGSTLNDFLSNTSVSLRKLANSSKVDTIKQYAANAGLTLSDKDIKKNKNAAKKLIANAFASQAATTLSNAIDNYGMDSSSVNSYKKDLNSMLKYYGYDKYY